MSVIFPPVLTTMYKCIENILFVFLTLFCLALFRPLPNIIISTSSLFRIFSPNGFFFKENNFFAPNSFSIQLANSSKQKGCSRFVVLLNEEKNEYRLLTSKEPTESKFRPIFYFYGENFVCIIALQVHSKSIIIISNKRINYRH